MTEDEMVGWHRFNGHELEQAPGDEDQGSLACCSPRGHKELDTTWQLNNNMTSNHGKEWLDEKVPEVGIIREKKQLEEIVS